MGRKQMLRVPAQVLHDDIKLDLIDMAQEIRFK